VPTSTTISWSPVAPRLPWLPRRRISEQRRRPQPVGCRRHHGHLAVEVYSALLSVGALSRQVDQDLHSPAITQIRQGRVDFTER
jgi:hypothetical protein